MLWEVYKHTGNVDNYTNYKEALNLATIELRKSKRNVEKNWPVIKKLAAIVYMHLCKK